MARRGHTRESSPSLSSSIGLNFAHNENKDALLERNTLVADKKRPNCSSRRPRPCTRILCKALLAASTLHSLRWHEELERSLLKGPSHAHSSRARTGKQPPPLEAGADWSTHASKQCGRKEKEPHRTISLGFGLEQTDREKTNETDHARQGLHFLFFFLLSSWSSESSSVRLLRSSEKTTHADGGRFSNEKGKTSCSTSTRRAHLRHRGVQTGRVITQSLSTPHIPRLPSISNYVRRLDRPEPTEPTTHTLTGLAYKHRRSMYGRDTPYKQKRPVSWADSNNTSGLA